MTKDVDPGYERRARLSHETAIRFDRISLSAAKTPERRAEITAVLDRNVADYRAKYGVEPPH